MAKQSMRFLLCSMLITGLVSGCVGMSFEKVPVHFDDPLVTLGITSLTPTPKENDGIVLRLQPSKTGVRHYREQHRMYAMIQEARGVEVDIAGTRRESYRIGNRDDSYIITSQTEFEKKKGTLSSEIEVTRLGDIVSFISGKHDSDLGKFHIIGWQRSPYFPEKPVTVGESWSYEEKLATKIKSFWVKEIDPEPHVLRATSTLLGFAQVRGRRCAVIETKALQQKQRRMKMLWQEIEYVIQADIAETTYLDYATGTVVGRVMASTNTIKGVNLPMDEKNRLQTIAYLLSSEKGYVSNDQ